MGRGGFKELVVWQRAKELAVLIYKVTNLGPFIKDYALKEQMRRAAVSVPSNIAEGDERDTDKEAVRFFFIAKGSAAELQTQAMIASEVGYLDPQTYLAIDKACVEIGSMLARLITSRSRTFKY